MDVRQVNKTGVKNSRMSGAIHKEISIRKNYREDWHVDKHKEKLK